MLNTVVNPMLNTLGGGGNRGNQLIQFAGVCNSSAATIVPVLVGYLMGSNEAARTIAKANPALFIAMGIFALAFVVLAVSNIPEPAYESASKEEKPAAGGKKYSAMSFRHFVLGIVAIFIYVGVEVGIPNIANLYMTQGLKLDPAMAGSLVGTYWFLMLVGRLIGGSIAGKVSSKAMLSGVSVIGLCLVLAAIFTAPTTEVMMPVFKSDISFGMVNVPANIMFLVLCGLCTSVMWGGIFNLAVEGLGKFTAAASGIFMVMVCGGGVLPAFQGFIADATSYMTSYWLPVAALAYICWFALLGSKVRK
jgi:FHS family L-fucose permease-like MFS transporter